MAQQRGVGIHDPGKDRGALRCGHGDPLPFRQPQAQVDVEVVIPVDRIESVQCIKVLCLDAETGGGDPAHLLLHRERREPLEHGRLTDPTTGGAQRPALPAREDEALVLHVAVRLEHPRSDAGGGLEREGCHQSPERVRMFETQRCFQKQQQPCFAALPGEVEALRRGGVRRTGHQNDRITGIREICDASVCDDPDLSWPELLLLQRLQAGLQSCAIAWFHQHDHR